ncbi:MAG: response regulator [Verrucomicrobiota bacterium]
MTPAVSPHLLSSDWLLLVSDDTALAREVAGVLAMPEGVRLARVPEAVSVALADGPDVVLLDADCAGCGFDELMMLLARSGGDHPLILISSHDDAERAVEAIKRGAENFIFKDRLARLAPAIWQARQNRERRIGHQRTTEALRASEQLLRATGRIAKVGGWSLELETNQLDWTEEIRRIHEVDANYAPNLDAAIGFYAPRVRPVLRAAVERAIAEGVAWDLELPLVTASGRAIWVRAQGEPVREDGRIVRLVGAFQEITERKLTEERLAQQAALLDMAPDAIVLRDLGHRILFWSRGAERVYGWTTEEATGRDFRDLPGLDLARLGEIERAVREAGSWQGELPRTLPDGGQLTLDCHWTFLRDPEGWPASILSIDTDVTERKRLETQFLRAQRMESIGTLAGGIAHDLNNILSPILMAGDLLRQHVESETGLRLLDNLGRSARRGADLVKQVLSFARGVEGQRVPVQIRHIAREVEDIVGNTFPKNITFESDVPRDLPLVVGDPTQINQVLVNLCVNARDAMPGGGRLCVTARPVEIDAPFAAMNQGAVPGAHVMISVSDEGTGMSPRVLEHIFEPFFTTKETGKGTGLGLSTVQAIMRSHGGFVNVRSEPGKGTMFKVHFPVCRGGGGEAAPAETSDEVPFGHGELILLVDDEVSIRNVTRQTLQSFGYQVLVAEDGAGAIGIYAQRAKDIALVITDIMMPIMDGPTLILAIRRINPEALIIASSGLTSQGGAQRAADIPVEHFLSKPYSARAMLRLVHDILRDR